MTFKVNGILWEIKEVDKDSTELKNNEVSGLGLCNYTTSTIYMADLLNESRFCNTLKHELTHAVMESNGFYEFENLNHEQLCEFVACHAATILQLADEYMTQRNILKN